LTAGAPTLPSYGRKRLGGRLLEHDAIGWYLPDDDDE
jgi:hypothetical protein